MNEHHLTKFIASVLLVCCCLTVHAKGKTLSVNVQNATLRQVFGIIEKQTDYRVSYRNVFIDEKKDITINQKNTTVDKVLDAALIGRSLTYSIVPPKTIIISDKTAPRRTAATSPQQADGKVRGTVTDANGEPIIGASVRVKGSTTGTVTDVNGNYSLQAGRGDIIEVSYVGFGSKEVKVAGPQADITMVEDEQSLDELVVVGYGTQKKGSITGAISAIKTEDIVTTKNENVQNMLTGKVAGVRVQQNTAEPGEFNNDFDIRGMGTPLIIVDGIPRDNMTRLDAEDIENISVLKDAAAAVYGVRAANGVVLITTKRGKAGSINLEYNGNFGFQYPSGSPKTVGAADAMTLKNEKNMHQGVDATGVHQFSDEEVAAWRNGTAGEEYDWYHEIYQMGAPQTEHTLSMSGGSEKINFYSSLGYLYQQAFFSNKNSNYERFNMRTNVSAKPYKSLTIEANMSAILENNHKNAYDTEWIVRCMQRAPKFYGAYANNNPDYLLDVPGMDVNTQAQSNADVSGYRRYRTKWLQTSASAQYDVPWVKGLSFKGLLSYDYQENNNKLYNKQFNLYTYDEASETYIGHAYNGPDKLTRQAYFRSSFLYQLSVQYQRLFADKHNVGALFLIEGRERKGDNFYAIRNLSLPIDNLFAGAASQQQGFMSTDQDDLYHINNLSYVGRLNYDYLSRYLFEFSFRYDGSSMFASDHRWGFFPAASAGWRVSEEKFWKESKLSFIDNFKLRVSYGKLGDDTAAAYQYITGYYYPATGTYNTLPNVYIFDGNEVSSSANRGVANKEITWYTAKTFDIGFDLDFWNGMLGFTFDFFNRNRDGLLTTRAASLPVIVGADLPEENLNSDRTTGFEIELSHRNHIKDFNYQVSGNVSFTRTKWKHYEHGEFGNSYDEWLNSLENRYADIWWGYDKGGRPSTYEEIANYPYYVDRATLPGDYVVADWNGDGQVNELDLHPVAYKGVPKINFGITLSAQWRGLDFTALLQGAAKKNISYTEILASPAWGRTNSGSLEKFLDRWTTVDPNANPFDTRTQWTKGDNNYPKDNGNSYILNSWLRYNTNYIRLKTIELGYTLPKNIVRVIGIQNLRVYVNAYNLLTICNMKYIDPEHTSDQWGCMYPLNKSFNIGVNINF